MKNQSPIFPTLSQKPSGDVLSSFHKELDLIQAVITRMSSNSFSVKGWTYAITGGVLGLCKDIFFKPDTGWQALFLCGVLAIIVLALWYLDAFFLKTEKQYRALYNWMVEARMSGNQEYKYCLHPQTVPKVKEEIEKDELLHSEEAVMGTKTLKALYIPLLVLISALALIHLAFTCHCF